MIGAGVGGCALAAELRRRGWRGSLTLLEIGRGPGGRCATRRSRRDPGLAINHGAPLFNITASPEPQLLEPLRRGGWLVPFAGGIHGFDADGQLRAPGDDPLCRGQLWQGQPQMDDLCRGLLTLANASGTPPCLRSGTLVRWLQPGPEPDGEDGWTLLDGHGAVLLRCRWLVLSGTLLSHGRCQRVFGWDDIPLQRAASLRNDPQLNQAAATLAAMDSSPSCHLLLTLPESMAQGWRLQPWRLLSFTAAAQERWGCAASPAAAPGRTMGRGGGIERGLRHPSPAGVRLAIIGCTDARGTDRSGRRTAGDGRPGAGPAGSRSAWPPLERNAS